MAKRVTCQMLYDQDKLTWFPTMLPASARDFLWQAALCGVPLADALGYALTQATLAAGLPPQSTRDIISRGITGIITKEVQGLYALYDRGCQAEFSYLSEQRPGVAEKIGSKYQQYRPLIRQAAAEPLDALLKITATAFPGDPATEKNKDVLVHPDIASKLEVARKSLLKELGPGRSGEISALRGRVLGFQWRHRATDPDKFTQHMLGRAVDIKAETNPIFAGDVATAADDILDFAATTDQSLTDPEIGRLRFRTSVLAAGLKPSQEIPESEIIKAYDRLTTMGNALLRFLRVNIQHRAEAQAVADDPQRPAADRQFATDFLDSDAAIGLLNGFSYVLGGGTLKGFAQDTDRKKRDQCLRSGARVIDTYLRKGLFDLPRELIVSMARAGLKWGGEWGEYRLIDAMHFEDPVADLKPCAQVFNVIGRARRRR